MKYALGAAHGSAGHAIIVGRGGWFITRDLPGGIHVRLVAPLGWRASQKAAAMVCSKKTAENLVQRTDRGRETFYSQYGPEGGLSPESFTITLNTARVEPNDLLQCILALVPSHGVEREAGGHDERCSQIEQAHG